MGPGEARSERHFGPGEDGRPCHATALLPSIEEVVAEAGGWSAIDRIAVGTGPGSFTGLRIGLATAQALSVSAEVELTGVCTLDALARGVEGAADGDWVAAVIDARRSQVFAALYRFHPPTPHRDVERLVGPVVCAPGDLATELGVGERPVVAVGSGALRFRDHLILEGLTVPGPASPSHTVSAGHLAALGALVESASQHPPKPIYLRAPDAERWRERDSKSTSQR